MNPRLVRRLALASIAMLLAAGCSNKKFQSKIKDLEGDLEVRQSEHETALEDRDRMIDEKEQAITEATEADDEKIYRLTEERDRLTAEVTQLQRKVQAVETEIGAKTPAETPAAGPPAGSPAKDPKIANAMVVVAGDNGKGAGFIVEDAGKRYLYTAAATVSGNPHLTAANAAGAKFSQFGTLEAAEGCQFVRVEVLEAAEAPALQLAPADLEVSPATKLSLLGVGLTNGTVTGTAVSPFGQSKEAIDFDPNVATGKTGGPLIDAATGKAIAIISLPPNEQAGLWTDPTVTGDAQPTAARINRDLTWQPMPLAVFQAEGKRIADFDRFSRVIEAFAAMTLSNAGLDVDKKIEDTLTIKEVLAGAKELPVVIEAMTLHSQLAAKKARIGEVDLKKRMTSMLATVATQSKRGLTGFDPAKFSGYHRKAVAQSLKWREDADRRLKDTAAGVAELDLKTE